MTLKMKDRVRPELTGTEAMAIIGLLWNNLKEREKKDGIDYPTVTLLGKMVKAARTELPKDQPKVE